MSRLVLQEHRTRVGVPLEAAQRDALSAVVRVSPTVGASGCYDLTPGSKVGVLAMPGLEVEIRPKIPIPRLMFLLSYAADPRHWKNDEIETSEELDVLEAVALGFVAQVRRAVSRGILQGYRTVEDTLLTVRGRIRIEDQMRRHFGRSPPAEVRFDDFTEDTDLNRILRAALGRLSRMRFRSPEVRRRVRATERLFAAVSCVEIDPRRPPEIRWSRLNERFRGAVEMALRILLDASFDLGGGGAKSLSFFVDMNRVFEDFVVVALREALGVPESALVQGGRHRKLHLDEKRWIRLRPDVSWWRGHECISVADVKYKRLETGEVKHADVYQLLAYTVATGLPRGLLIYAKGEHDPRIHTVLPVGKDLEIATIDLSASPPDILAQVAELAERMRGALV